MARLKSARAAVDAAHAALVDARRRRDAAHAALVAHNATPRPESADWQARGPALVAARDACDESVARARAAHERSVARLDEVNAEGVRLGKSAAELEAEAERWGAAAREVLKSLDGLILRVGGLGRVPPHVQQQLGGARSWAQQVIETDAGAKALRRTLTVEYSE